MTALRPCLKRAVAVLLMLVPAAGLAEGPPPEARTMAYLQETVELMYEPIDPVLQHQENGPPRPTEFSQALIWRILKDDAGRTFVNHCGTVKGYNACLVIYREQDLAVAILGNGYPTPARREAVAIAQLFLSP